MTANIRAVQIDGFDPTGSKLEADILEHDLLATLQRDNGCAARESDRFARRGNRSDDILVHRQTWVHIPYRKDRTICIAAIAEIKIAAKGQ